MSQVRPFLRLYAMRRTAGAGVRQSAAWAAGLLWRNHRASQRQRL
ncbi:hypothetical protein [Comamonas sp. wu1-DMT]